MPVATLRALLRAEVERHLPSHALAVAKVAERSERESLDLLAQLIAEEGIEELIGRAR